jgi:predicted transcriptional regulator
MKKKWTDLSKVEIWQDIENILAVDEDEWFSSSNKATTAIKDLKIVKKNFSQISVKKLNLGKNLLSLTIFSKMLYEKKLKEDQIKKILFIVWEEYFNDLLENNRNLNEFEFSNLGFIGEHIEITGILEKLLFKKAINLIKPRKVKNKWIFKKLNKTELNIKNNYKPISDVINQMLNKKDRMGKKNMYQVEEIIESSI